MLGNKLAKPLPWLLVLPINNPKVPVYPKAPLPPIYSTDPLFPASIVDKITDFLVSFKTGLETADLAHQLQEYGALTQVFQAPRSILRPAN